MSYRLHPQIPGLKNSTITEGQAGSSSDRKDFTMFLYSDIITQDDLSAAARVAGVSLERKEDLSYWGHASRRISNPRTVNPNTGRPYQVGYEVFLSGSSHARSQVGNFQAATWDEWGIFMVELYRIDPEARIGWYKTLEDFITETTRTRDHYAHANTVIARAHRAPWLDGEIIAYDDDAQEYQAVEDISYKF